MSTFFVVFEIFTINKRCSAIQLLDEFWKCKITKTIWVSMENTNGTFKYESQRVILALQIALSTDRFGFFFEKIISFSKSWFGNLTVVY